MGWEFDPHKFMLPNDELRAGKCSRNIVKSADQIQANEYPCSDILDEL